ncbi:type II toxin-antitoxin system HicA family toxin [Micromonospora inyonensis]|uniref:type II toxin-antitoxin system HicA family toxin n=1 Tax=Micromonospora inyonensis TaxID=47866 RepID=UPI000B1350F1
MLDALKQAGFDHVRTKGSHAVYRNPAGNVVVVPQHGTIKRGTLASILRQARSDPGGVPRPAALSPSGGAFRAGVG